MLFGAKTMHLRKPPTASLPPALASVDHPRNFLPQSQIATLQSQMPPRSAPPPNLAIGQRVLGLNILDCRWYQRGTRAGPRLTRPASLVFIFILPPRTLTAGGTSLPFTAPPSRIRSDCIRPSCPPPDTKQKTGGIDASQPQISRGVIGSALAAGVVWTTRRSSSNAMGRTK